MAWPTHQLLTRVVGLPHMLGTATPHTGTLLSTRCPSPGCPDARMPEGRSASRGPYTRRKDRGHRVISSPRTPHARPGNPGLRHRTQTRAAESPLCWVSRWPVARETCVCACARCTRVRMRVCACMCARALPGRGASGLFRFGAGKWCLSLPGCARPSFPCRPEGGRCPLSRHSAASAADSGARPAPAPGPPQPSRCGAARARRDVLASTPCNCVGE